MWLELKPASDPGYTYDCQSNRMMGPRVAANRYRSRLDRFAPAVPVRMKG